MYIIAYKNATMKLGHPGKQDVDGEITGYSLGPIPEGWSETGKITDDKEAIRTQKIYISNLSRDKGNFARLHALF